MVLCVCPCTHAAGHTYTHPGPIQALVEQREEDEEFSFFREDEGSEFPPLCELHNLRLSPAQTTPILPLEELVHPDTQEEDGHTSDSSAGSECLGKQVCSRPCTHTHARAHTHTHFSLGSHLTPVRDQSSLKNRCVHACVRTHTLSHFSLSLSSNLTEIIKTSRDWIRLSDKLGYTLHVNKSFPNGAESRQEEGCISFRRGPGLGDAAKQNHRK